MMSESKISLIAAPQLIDRGTWIRLDENTEPFTAENAKLQLSASPLDMLSQLSSFNELAKKCTCIDLCKNIEALNEEFLKEIFEKKKQKFWSYAADDCLEKYFSFVEKNVKSALAKNRSFIAIGGSHSIAWPASKAIFNHYNNWRDKISVVFFDEGEDNFGNGLEKIRQSMYHGSWAGVVQRKFNYEPFLVRPESFDSSELAAELKGKKFLQLSVDIDVFNKETCPSTFYSRFDDIYGVGTMTYELWGDYLKEVKKIADENYVKVLGADISEFIPYGHLDAENKKTAETFIKLLNDLYNVVK